MGPFRQQLAGRDYGKDAFPLFRGRHSRHGDQRADAYDPETNTIFYEGGRGGGPLCLRVTSWMQEGDRLVIDYEGYEYYSGVPWEDGFYTLTVKTMEDGSFRYLSNLPRN